MKLRWLWLAGVLAACGSRAPCNDGTVERSVCTACGPTDACVNQAIICAPTCGDGGQCSGSTTCVSGACVPFPCG